MKTMYFTLILSLLLFKLDAQSTFGPDPGMEIPRIIPPTPNAAALEKFGTIPVDYSTGIPSITYPMWSWSGGRLSFNVGLSYHAGGHKVDDMASNVGLGWSLTGIGQVTRTVRGIRDDEILHGYMYTPVLPQMVTYLYEGGYVYADMFYIINNVPTENPGLVVNPVNSPHSPLVIQIADGVMDAEQDIFSYSFNGYSGRFVIDKNRNIIPLENTNLKIEMVCNSIAQPWTSESGKITAFKITDDNGIIYLFEHTEEQFTTTITSSPAIEGPPPQNVISGWQITEVKDPISNESITFNYSQTSNGEVEYETGWSQSQIFDLNRPDYQSGLLYPAFEVSSDVISHSKITILNESNVTGINFPDGSQVFLEYSFLRDDMVNSTALSNVTVKNSNNEIVKKFNLNYSYFYSSINNTPLYLFESVNDYNKRLKLDGVDEVSSDDNFLKPATFIYNTTRLNTRGSKNIDYWGYNVNPARGNLYYVPRIELELPERLLAPGHMYFSGADRRPDAQYVKAALLEEIVYPTGGSTSFEYECNRVLSEKDYYEDQLFSNNLEWYQNSFNQEQAIQFPSRLKTNVEFLFQTEEFDPRPEPDPNEPQVCPIDLQDQIMVQFEIKSTDNAFSTIVETSYASCLGPGYKRVIDLPLDKSYTVKFIYDAGLACAFMYPFKAKASGTYYVAPYEKLAGGVRIKRIVSDDSFGNSLVKEYDYNKDDGYSSAVLNTIPNFSYYRTTVDRNEDQSPILYTNHINRNSNPNYSLNYHNGAPLIYTRVREKETDNSLTERHYDPLAYMANGYPDQYPYLPGQDFPNLSGLLTRQIIKDKYGNIKTEELIEYEKNLVRLTSPETRNLKAGAIASAVNYDAKFYVVDNYHLCTSRAQETSRTTKTYENGNVSTQTVNNTYHSTKYYLTEAETTNSKGEARAKHFFYPFDLAGPEMAALVQYNILKPVVSQATFIPGTPQENLVRKKTSYTFWNSGSIPLPLSEERSLLDNSFETELVYNEYDDRGDLLQYTTKDGVVTSFIWGYHQQYPVAKITGKSYSDAIAISGLNLSIVDNPANDETLRTELNKLRSLSGCLVTTFTYKPLVGITSETGPDNKTNYYEYDMFNRLYLIKDDDGNVMQKWDYHYKGQ